MSLGSDVPVPKRKVLHKSWSEGYRSGTRLHFILECGHTVSRPASRGANPQTCQCWACWSMAVCATHGHLHKNGATPCNRCLKAHEWFGRAKELIARYDDGK